MKIKARWAPMEQIYSFFFSLWIIFHRRRKYGNFYTNTEAFGFIYIVITKEIFGQQALGAQTPAGRFGKLKSSRLEVYATQFWRWFKAEDRWVEQIPKPLGKTALVQKIKLWVEDPLFMRFSAIYSQSTKTNMSQCLPHPLVAPTTLS